MARVTAFIDRGDLERGIDFLFDVRRPNSGTKNLLDSRRSRAVTRARTLCPVREGTLVRSHFSTPPVNGPNGSVIATFGNSAPYAVYVHEGTDGTSGPNYWQGWGPWGGQSWYFKEGVSGQDANPWLARGYNQAARESTDTTVFRKLEESDHKAAKRDHSRRAI